jgi:hypothetical protein
MPYARFEPTVSASKRSMTKPQTARPVGPVQATFNLGKPTSVHRYYVINTCYIYRTLTFMTMGLNEGEMPSAKFVAFLLCHNTLQMPTGWYGTWTHIRPGLEERVAFISHKQKVICHLHANILHTCKNMGCMHFITYKITRKNNESTLRNLLFAQTSFT